MRWAHILAAIVAVGGIIFLRFVLMPAANAVLSPEEHGRLRPVLIRRWQKFVHVCIALFLISGLYNYIALMVPVHRGQGLYHALFGIKFLLALVVFFLAVALASSGEKFSGIKAKRTSMMTALITLAVIIVLISGYMRFIPQTS